MEKAKCSLLNAVKPGETLDFLSLGERFAPWLGPRVWGTFLR